MRTEYSVHCCEIRTAYVLVLHNLFGYAVEGRKSKRVKRARGGGKKEGKMISC